MMERSSVFSYCILNTIKSVQFFLQLVGDGPP